MSILKSSIIVSFFTLISRVFGFIRDIFIAGSLGTTVLADIFNIAFRLPNFFRRLFAEGAFNAAFVPMISHKIMEENGKENAKKFSNQIFTILFIFLAILITLMEIFMPFCIGVFAPGFKSNVENFNLAVTLSRITMPYLLFISIVSFHSAILNSLGFFIASAAISVLLNFSLIIAIVFFKKLTPTAAHALSFGILFAGIIQFSVMYIIIKREKILPKFTKPIISEDVKTMFKNMIPAIFSSGITQINLWVDTIFASMILSAVSTLAYADRVMQLPVALIGTAIGTVLLPSISRRIKEGDTRQTNTLQNRTIEAAAFFAIPAAFALVTISQPIISILFERGAFTNHDTIQTANALSIFAIGLPAFILVKILVPNFFARYDTKTPVKVSIICLLFNIFFCWVLTPKFGHLGIAMATTISGWIGSGSLAFLLINKRMLEIDLKCKIRLLKITVAASLMSVYLKTFQSSFSTESYNILPFACMIISGLTIYIILISILKVFSVKETYRLLK